MTKPRISVASAKSKGRNLQKHVRDALLELHPSLTVDDCRSCPMGSTGADIQFSQAAKALIPFDFECKARANIALVYDALAQAQRDPNRPAIAVIKADRKAPLAVMEFDLFMSMLAIILEMP